MSIIALKNDSENFIVVVTDIGQVDPLENNSENLIVVLQDVGQKGDLGINFRGDYEANIQYFQGDAVNFNGVVYIVTTTPPVGTDPTNGVVPPIVNNNWATLIDQAANTLGVQGHGNMPTGNLQDALNYLEDKMFSSALDPTTDPAHAGEGINDGGAGVDDGDLWYDQVNDQMNVYRDGEWEVMTLNDALAFDPTDDPTNPDDSIEMDGGTF